jgi:hypothetical protein
MMRLSVEFSTGVTPVLRKKELYTVLHPVVLRAQQDFAWLPETRLSFTTPHNSYKNIIKLRLNQIRDEQSNLDYAIKANL